MIKSIFKNSIFSGFKSILSILFPLIAFKIASNILGSTSIGEIEFARSWVNYFLLISGLGISVLATRNGSAVRDDKKELEKFSSSIFSLNFLSGFIAFTLLILSVFIIPEIKKSLLLVLIFSIQIPLSILSVEWMYNIFENFKFITYRTIIALIISLTILLLFVKDVNDVWIYAIVLIGATYGGSIYSYINSKKMIKYSLKLNKNTFQYFPNAMILFFNQIATTIYVNMDITMLGFYTSKSDIGIYIVAVRIYTAAKIIVMAILHVTLPRLTNYYHGEKINEYSNLVNNIIRVILLIIPPIILGIIFQSKTLILIVSSEEFLPATFSLFILSISLLFSTIAMFFSSAILLPRKNEKNILLATSLAATFNFVLNLFLIPVLGIIGAAITTLIAELIVASVLILSSLKMIKKSYFLLISHDIVGIGLGCLFITLVNLNMFNIENNMMKFVYTVAFSILGYFTIVLVFKNTVIIKLIKKFKDLI